MGACYSQQLQNRRIIGNPIIEGVSTKKFSQKYSSLNFFVRTWSGYNLPNLRNVQGMNQKYHTFAQEGKVLLNWKQQSATFQNSQNNIEENKSLSKKVGSDPKNTIEIQVQKRHSGFQIDFVNDPGYELLTGQKEISMGQRFFMSGLQYQMIGLFTNDKETSFKAGENQRTRDSSDFSNSSNTSSNKSVSSRRDSDKKVPIKQQSLCRICLGNEFTDDNPFVSPCDCTGSVKYCHLNCWKTWIMSIQTGNKQYYRGSVLKQKCEICKKDLLTDQDYREKVIEILLPNVNIPKPFVVLQATQPKGNCLYVKRKTQKLSYIFISFAQKSRVSLGCSSEVDVPLTGNLGKGRRNACIELKDGKIILNDSITKYGTFIKRQSPVLIKDNVPKHFLYKNSIISVQIE